MKITILNGNPDPNNHVFESYLGRLVESLSASGGQTTLLTLREMDIRYCIGCFGCWVKTPGECFSPDESCQVRRAVLHSDFTLWASPLKMGFPSALLKKMMDKSIPLIHPYFEVDHNEAHHRPRYDHYPRLGLLVEREVDTDEADLAIVSDIFSRTALNMKSRLEFALTTDQPVEVVARAILFAENAGKQAGIAFQRHLPATTGERIAPPRRLTVFNGSPRGRKGNTPIMLDQFTQGFCASGQERSAEVYHLNHLNDLERHTEAFGEAECVLLGFPLYTDAMPGIVKDFIERLEPYRGRTGNPPIGFLVQSGFPESAHSRHVERYLEKLAHRLGSLYLGTMVKGGGEGVRMMPENMNCKLFDTLQGLGRTFGDTGSLDPALLRTLAGTERYPAYLAPVFKIFVRLPVASFYWDMLLKQNGAYERRFARPYES